MPNDYFNPPNSIWPNGLKKDDEGYAVFYPLGTNKVDVPTNSPHWPKGDKLVSPFVYQDDKLVGFCDTKAMVGVDGSTIIMPYEHIEVDFSSIEKDSIQIHAPKATTKTVIWKNSNKEDIADVNYKYKGCTTVNEITAVDENYMTTDVVDGTWNEILSDLENSRGMFESCNALTTFNSDLSSLTNGTGMFMECSSLTTFNSDLSSLTTANTMFYGCTALTTFNSDLPSLTNASNMFGGCTNLTTFTSNLRNLRDAGTLDNGGMFAGCSKLTTFKSNLSHLQYGRGMFKGCSLNTESIACIAETIQDVHHLTNNTYNDDRPVLKQIHIGIANEYPTEEEDKLLTKIYNKGWEVFVNGSDTAYAPADGTVLIPIDGEQTITSKPYWAKPVPATEEDANYIDENGNFFNILGGQFIYVSDPDTYGMFTCEDDAAANMRLTPYSKNQTNI